jgi:hypothetical protein
MQNQAFDIEVADRIPGVQAGGSRNFIPKTKPSVNEDKAGKHSLTSASRCTEELQFMAGAIVQVSAPAKGLAYSSELVGRAVPLKRRATTPE